MSSAVARSRPGSLLEAVPVREPLRFDVQLVGAPPEVEQLVNNIKQVAEDFLYHWKTFPIGRNFLLHLLSSHKTATELATR